MRYVGTLLLFFTVVLSVQADERVFSEYQYDQIGNTVVINKDLTGVAPTVNSFTPEIVRQSQVIDITLDGDGLRGAQLSNADGFFSFSNIRSTNEQIVFTLAVDEFADEGASQISVSTGLGTTFFSLNILTELPDLRLSPIPVVIETNSVTPLLISLSKRDVLDHVVTVSVADANIATVNQAQISFDTGSLTPNQSLEVTAAANGSTRLFFESATLGNYSYNIRVTDSVFEIEPGVSNTFIGQNVGVNKLFTPPPPDLVAVGPFRSELRVTKLAAPVDDDSAQLAFANQVGLLKGRYFSSISPNAVAANSSNATLTVTGAGLSLVDDVAIIPSDGVTLSQLVADPSGESLTLQIDVADGVALSKRQLILSAGTEKISPARTGVDRIYIGGTTPTINSVSPIYFNRGDVRTVVVRGQNLETVRALRFDDNSGLEFSRPVVAAGGTQLTFELQIVGFARIGQRQLILESLLGDGSALNVDASVIFIQDRPPVDISPVVSPLVGINKQIATDNEPVSDTTYSRLVGVTRGSNLSGLAPRARSQGSSFTLSLEGVGLNSVVSAEFAPAEGITVGDYSAAADGLSATLQLEIATDATPTIRQLKLSNGAAFINAESGADRFEVTLPRPQINSVSPIQVAQGDVNVALLIRGELLNDATAINITPADGITLSSPIASLDGTQVNATISVSPTASKGPRVIQLSTPGGSTEAGAMVSNTLQIVEEITNIVTPILSAVVGVQKETVPVTVTEEIAVVSTGIGIVKQVTPPVVENAKFAFAPLVGISKGEVASSIDPTSISINSIAQQIEVTGVNLDNVTTVQTIPADGVTLNGPAIISADGTTVTFSADVASDAAQTARRLELITATGTIPFINPAQSLMQITGLTPEINSIEPIQEVRGASFVMTIRGINFETVQSVQASPSNGITIGTPSAAADGRSLTVQVFIAANASTEQKVITVSTSAGTTTSASMPENTFTVISE